MEQSPRPESNIRHCPQRSAYDVLQEEVLGRNHKSNGEIVGNLAVAYTNIGNIKAGADLNARLNVLMRS